MPDGVTCYRGRFAPTPSGPLHFGSLVAALASYLDARSHSGNWLLRMEDVDRPRVVPGAADDILRALEAFGFEWDGPVLWQGTRYEEYQAALDQLQAMGVVYPCTCSRKQLAQQSSLGIDGLVYPGTCRSRTKSPLNTALRLNVSEHRISFLDAEQGQVNCDVARECGDFVLKRADGIFSYQLAVIVDDAAQGITDVVRGADLLTSTPRQIVLQRMLNLPTPTYRHLAVALDALGNKLSKQTLAAPINRTDPLAGLQAAARFLGMLVPKGLANAAEFWDWAKVAWSTRPATPLRGKRMTLHGTQAG